MPLSCGDSCAEGSLETNQPPQKNLISDSTHVSLLSVPKMDCPSEENIIRLALNNLNQIQALEFDLGQREIKIFHQADVADILEKLTPLNLGVKLIKTDTLANEEKIPAADISGNAQQTSTLYWLLAINGAMFFLELSLGLMAQSTGLIADSLDMFADAAVYGLALYAVGRSSQLQVRAAHLSGWAQMLLAMGVLAEVGRRFFYGSEPQSPLMIGVGALALIANISCLVLIHRHRDGGAHMKASWIFSANDVIANLGVIIAGALVAWTGSRYPDLVIGSVIGLIVLNGARRILQLKG